MEELRKIFEHEIKRKLAEEGLFEKEHKRDLPRFPKRIGVITSRGGSVIHDIVKTVMQNWPYCRVILFPASVQGPASKNELVFQIRRADEFDMDISKIRIVPEIIRHDFVEL